MLTLLVATGPACAHEGELEPAREAVRQQRLAEARAALALGEAQRASDALDAAAAMSHAPDTELLQLQAQLQRGEFRQALAFAAHAAGGHADEPEALALHLWLLALSGQAAHAGRLLATQANLVGLEALAAALLALDGSAPLPAGLPGPVPHGVPVPEGARPVAGGLLLDGGRLALVPAQALQDDGPLWVRNGLGQASLARPLAPDAALAAEGLAALTLSPPLTPPPTAVPLLRAPRTAFAGSPAARLAALRLNSAAPAWPWLQAGFLGRVGRTGAQALGWSAGAALPGGPVFDTAGRLVGLALPAPDGERLLPAAGFAPLLALPAGTDAAARTPDQVYETALPYVAQLLR